MILAHEIRKMYRVASGLDDSLADGGGIMPIISHDYLVAALKEIRNAADAALRGVGAESQ